MFTILSVPANADGARMTSAFRSASRKIWSSGTQRPKFRMPDSLSIAGILQVDHGLSCTELRAPVMFEPAFLLSMRLRL